MTGVALSSVPAPSQSPTAAGTAGSAYEYTRDW